LDDALDEELAKMAIGKRSGGGRRGSGGTGGGGGGGSGRGGGVHAGHAASGGVHSQLQRSGSRSESHEHRGGQPSASSPPPPQPLPPQQYPSRAPPPDASTSLLVSRAARFAIQGEDLRDRIPPPPDLRAAVQPAGLDLRNRIAAAPVNASTESGKSVTAVSTSASDTAQRADAAAAESAAAATADDAGDDEGSHPHVVGTCALMCPAAERLGRERSGELDLLERADPADRTVSSQTLAVKKYTRIVDGMSPGLVRTRAALEATTGHLYSLLGGRADYSGVPGELPLLARSNFLWDRLRGVGPCGCCPPRHPTHYEPSLFYVGQGESMVPPYTRGSGSLPSLCLSLLSL